MENPTRSGQKRWAVRLALTAGVALLSLAALWGLRGAIPARADPGTLYVDGATGSDSTDCSDPAAPCETIGYGLTQAANGDEIYVTEGTYTETLDVAFPVTLRGGYTISGTLWLPRTGETIVDADGADDSVFEIINANVTIEGFTIQGADRSAGEGGIAVAGSTVVISGTTVRGNETADIGGGVAIGGVSNVSLINSTVVDNVAGHGGGGIMVDGPGAHARIVNVVVEGNEANYGGGVGIWLQGPVVVMANTVISGNFGNAAGGLTMWDVGGVLTGTNLLIVGNHSGPGPAGMALWEGNSGLLMNVTVSGNDAATGFDGAVIEGPASGFPIVNSIFWGNGTIGTNLGGNDLDVTYSDVQGGFAGSGNIDADPLFVGGGDYHLTVGSPCVDVGTPAGAPAHDIEGTLRDAMPDMGAYEWTGSRAFLPLTLRATGP